MKIVKTIISNRERSFYNLEFYTNEKKENDFIYLFYKMKNHLSQKYILILKYQIKKPKA